MQYTCHYPSPLGGIIVSSDGEAITGLWFDGRKYSTDPAAAAYEEKPLPLFEQAKRWLDLYFSGEEPPFVPAIRLHGSSFQLAVWEILRQIPYGQLVTYHDIAKEIARRRGIDRMAAQAVGGAVGRNPVSIMVLKKCDFVFLQELSNIGVLDTKQIDTAFEYGYQQALSMMTP